MIRHIDIEHDKLIERIKDGRIRFGGHLGYSIYGTLECKGGKRMKRENRVFFATEDEAMRAGFRPCGNCMRVAYRVWKGEEEEEYWA